MTTCIGQLVGFLGSELQSSGPCDIDFLIKLGPNNYLKVSNVDRSEPRGFYGHSKLTNFWAFWHLLYATLTPPLGVDMRSKKINGHHIVRQNLMENPKKNNRFAPRELLFWTKYGS